jgi:hypothetical protein
VILLLGSVLGFVVCGVLLTVGVVWRETALLVAAGVGAIAFIAAIVRLGGAA